MNYAKAAQCALLSQEIYQDFAKLKFSGFSDVTPDFLDQQSTDTQCAIFSDTNQNVYIVFRGSEKQIDWRTNLDFGQREIVEEQVVQSINQEQDQVYPYAGKSQSGAKMHKGFVSAYTPVRERIHQYLRSHAAANVIVTGHSLGGALATLCAVDVQYNFSNLGIEMYTFGAPRVGNGGFRESFNRRVPNSYRFIYGMDIVPALPRPWQGYQHVDKEYRLGPRFSLNFLSQRFKDHSIANYVTALQQQVSKVTP